MVKRFVMANARDALVHNLLRIHFSMRRLFGFSLTVLFILAINISVQAQMAAKYDVDRFDITARIDTAANSADITTVLKLTNTGNAPGRSITLRFGSGKVSAVSVNGSSATFSQRA